MTVLALLAANPLPPETQAGQSSFWKVQKLLGLQLRDKLFRSPWISNRDCTRSEAIAMILACTPLNAAGLRVVLHEIPLDFPGARSG